jgi:hypothetical protein
VRQGGRGQNVLRTNQRAGRKRVDQGIKAQAHCGIDGRRPNLSLPLRAQRAEKAHDGQNHSERLSHRDMHGNLFNCPSENESFVKNVYRLATLRRSWGSEKNASANRR